MLVLGAAALTAQISALPAPPVSSLHSLATTRETNFAPQAVVCQHFAFEDLLSSDPDALQRLGRFFRLKRKILDFARSVTCVLASAIRQRALAER